MEHRNGMSGVIQRAGLLGAGTMALGLLLVSPAAVRAQDRAWATRSDEIHIVGLDSARAASIRACRRLQAYGMQVATDKFKALRGTSALVKTVDSLMAEVQRPNRYKETLVSFLGLTTLPDSLQSLTATAGASCSPVPSQMAFQRLVQGELRRLPRLGVMLQPLNRQSAATLGLSDTLGVVVQAVSPDLGAHAAGIVAGDVIVALNARPVGSITDLREVVASLKNGEVVSVEIVRKGGARQKVNVKAMVKP